MFHSGQSILERLMKLDLYSKNSKSKYDRNYITKLLRNYRSHAAIIRTSNELFYDNELIASNKVCSLTIPNFPQEFPVLFHGVNGNEKKEEKSTR